MPSKKVTISQKIFIFLLLTVGIVFILLQVYRSVREGFQLLDDVNCEVLKKPPNNNNTGDRKIYVCQTRDQAISEINNMDDKSYEDVAVCYTDVQYNEDTKEYSNKNFYAGSSNLPTKFYTCFNRPVSELFDPSIGVKLPISELDDEQPYSGIDSLQTNCAVYNGAFQTYLNSYIKTSSILGSVNTIGFSNIASSINVLSTVSSSKCRGDNTAGNTATGVCRSINTGIRLFVNMRDNTGPSSLSLLTSVITESKNLLSNEIYTVLKPAFLNSGCIADTAEYNKII